MSWRMIVLVFASVIIFTNKTFANGPIRFFDGSDLHEICQNHSSLALGYVIGAMDYSEHIWWGNPPIDGQLCAPAALNSGMIRDIVCEYVDQHQKDHERAAASLIERAMTEGFPCPEWVSRTPVSDDVGLTQ